MSTSTPHRPNRVTESDLAELADAVLALARKLDLRHRELRDVVPLTGTEVSVIRELLRNPGITPSQLAAVTGLQRSNLSTALRGLEASGLLLRETDNHNARNVLLRPTDKAKRGMESIKAFWIARLRHAGREDLLQALSAIEVLQRIAAGIDEGA